MNLQLILSIFGLWLVLFGWVGYQADEVSTGQPRQPAASSGQSLKVVPASQRPAAVADQLQGAGGLQRQGTGGLQSAAGQQLQPNAKTGSLNPTRPVQ